MIAHQPLGNGVSRHAHALTDTTLQMLRTFPNLALIRRVILWFGIGEEAKLFLTTLGVFFPTHLSTPHGVRTVDPEERRLLQSQKMSHRYACRPSGGFHS